MSRRLYDEENRPLCCWLSQMELAHFRAVAQANNVSAAAYLRAMVIDVLAEESGRVPVPRRALRPNIFAVLHGDTDIPVEELK